MKLVDVKSRTYIDFNVENNEKDPKLESDDYVRILKNKNVFANGYAPNWSEKVFLIKNTVPQIYLIDDIYRKEIVGRFHKNELQKTNQPKFKAEKVIKRKCEKLYVI